MNLLADLYDFQAIDVLEEWKETFHTPLLEEEEPRLLEQAGLDEDNFRVVTDKLDPGDTALAVKAVDLAHNFRPTEHCAFANNNRKQYVVGKNKDGSERKIWMNLQEYMDWKKNLAKVSREKAIAMRSAFVKALDADHRKFVESVKAILQTANSMADLYALTTVCIEHDQSLSKIAGRSFCNTFAEIPYNFFSTEERIKALKPAVKAAHVVVPQTVVVATVSYPIMMVKKGGKAWAYTPRMKDRLESQGYAPATN
jgi:hypothetical protein